MARGKKTGGRNFVKGDPRAGRPKGSRDKVPRTFKGSIRLLCEQIATDDPDLVRSAFVRGLKAAAPKSFAYLQLLAHYRDGKPADTVKVQPDLSALSEEELRAWEAFMLKVHAGANAG